MPCDDTAVANLLRLLLLDAMIVDCVEERVRTRIDVPAKFDSLYLQNIYLHRYLAR